MKSLNVVLCIWGALSIPFVTSELVRFDDYQIFHVPVESSSIFNLLQDKINSLQLDVWHYPGKIGDNIEILVSPAKCEEFKAFLESNNISYDIAVENVQRLIDEEQSNISDSKDFNFERYYNLDQIYGYLDRILERFPGVTSSFVIGKSYEGRDIRGLKISYQPNNPGIFIEANIHARDWIASATATFLIDTLLTSNNISDVESLTKNFDWYIIPVLNVDGFVYTHESNRLWHKSRQPNSGSKCIGTDLNRNFNSSWLVNGGACSETYAGPTPFSAPETLAFANFYRSVKDKIKLFLSFQSYGQYILSPYGHSNEAYPSNFEGLVAVGTAAAEAITSRFGTYYGFRSIASEFYKAGGTGTDWAYSKGGTRLAYTFEFRDKGTYGFLLPASQIISNGLEALEGIEALLTRARKLAYL